MDSQNFKVEQFVLLLTESQPRLSYYIRTLVPDHASASDLLQDVNVILWRRASEFTLGTNFLAWARKVAYFEVLSWYRDRSREKLVFDVELVESLAKQSESRSYDEDSRKVALKNCMTKLTDAARDLIQKRYDGHQSVQSIAKQQNKTVGSISQALYRIRHQLMECMNQNVVSESE